jgi:tRNA A37 methylthiotransferase MiaB
VARSLPDLTIRSTFIAGFPGETEEEFQTLLDFIAEAELDRVGCFAYSPVEGATANDLPGALPDEVREERRARFMEVAEEVSARRCSARSARRCACWSTRSIRTVASAGRRRMRRKSTVWSISIRRPRLRSATRRATSSM